MTVKADSISNKPSKKNRRTLSDRFNEFETQAKQKKTEEEKEPTGNSSGATTTVTSKPAKQSKPNQTVFTIQVPSKQPSLKQSSQPLSSKQTTTLKAPVNAPKLAAKPPQKVTLVPGMFKCSKFCNILCSWIIFGFYLFLFLETWLTIIFFQVTR